MTGYTAKLILLSHAIVLQFSTIDAFTLNPHRNARKLSDDAFFAKPPPKSSFDLDAIEALEAELDYQEKLKNQKDDDVEDNEEDEWEILSSTADQEGLKQYEVTEKFHNKRIDAILSAMEPEMSRSQCGSLISDGMVAVLLPEDAENGQKPTVTSRKSLKLPKGTMMHVKHAVDETPTEIVAQKLPLNILYEDEHMIVLNKAAGMVVHPAVGNWDGTVVNALAYYLANESPFGPGEFIEADGKVRSQNAEGVDVDGTDGETITFRPGIVHRLDKGTTGILIVAKSRESLSALSASFANRQVRKTYAAITGESYKRFHYLFFKFNGSILI
jgi:23S rRNA-/tRNA-specific pseudouridylate synthase